MKSSVDRETKEKNSTLYYREVLVFILTCRPRI